MAIVINLDVMMAKRKIGLTELAKEVDITLANLSILKNNKRRQFGSRHWRQSARRCNVNLEISWNMWKTRFVRKSRLHKF